MLLAAEATLGAQLSGIFTTQRRKGIRAIENLGYRHGSLNHPRTRARTYSANVPLAGTPSGGIKRPPEAGAVTAVLTATRAYSGASARPTTRPIAASPAVNRECARIF